jgi:hypothetical protein
MAETLPIVAQKTMDLYYASYKSSSQFFDLDDFIFYTGTTIADIYQQEAKAQYSELRALKTESVVSFPADWLVEQRLKVQRKDNETFVILEKPIMGFSFDNQILGLQDVIPIKPKDVILERTTQSATWQNRLMPFTNRIFWYGMKDKILFFKKGGCNISEVSVLYVPAIGNDMLVPEGIEKTAIDQTVATMKQLIQGTVVKKATDGNQNMVMEGEINKMSLKQ